MRTAMDSPALAGQSETYPEHFRGRVPKRVRVLKMPRVIACVPTGLVVGELFDVFVRADGSLFAIANDGSGRLFGLAPGEFEVIEWHNWPVAISDEWLRAVGFKWHQFDLQPGKQWLLWLDPACVEPDGRGKRAYGQDLGIELAAARPDAGSEGLPSYFCWLRADTSHRYSRFLHVRHLRWQHDLIAMIEGLTGAKWDPANNVNGAMLSPEEAARWHAERDRLDQRILRESKHHRAIEQDDTRGGALPEHMQAAVDAGRAK